MLTTRAFSRYQITMRLEWRQKVLGVQKVGAYLHKSDYTESRFGPCAPSRNLNALYGTED